MASGMKLTVDTVADAAYFTVGATTMVDTLMISDDVNVDVDAAGEIVGVELLRLSATLEVSELTRLGMRHATAIRIVHALKALRGRSFSQGSEGLALNQQELCPA